MSIKARQSLHANGLELETDAGTLKKMLAMIAGTVAIMAFAGVGGVLIASGSAKSMLGFNTYITHHTSASDKFAKQIVTQCKLGAVVLTASRDPARVAAGRDLADQCDEVGDAIKSLPVTR